jgi:hypothetical protein
MIVSNSAWLGRAVLLHRVERPCVIARTGIIRRVLPADLGVKTEWMSFIERAKARLYRKRFKEALHDLDQVVQLCPRQANAFFMRGWAHKVKWQESVRT